jgi:Fe-S oxidoreductase
MFGPELVQAFREFKAIWDPTWKMNPGKLVEPYRMDENLRLGAGYDPWQPETHFQFPEDHGSLANATLRCVGVGKCRRYGGGLMCPSFRVTREEEHSTRGRAHLLWEMTQGDIVRDGWKDERVKESLDLCLACKGCKSDCPVSVDVATYKAEFLAHYYQGRVRPLNQLVFGNIDIFAELASHVPGFVNLATQLPILSEISKLLGGIPRQRRIPALAPETFKSWFAHRKGKNLGCTAVILWPDTFNNYFQPDTAKAAVEVLEAAGFHVLLPEGNLCCGRPLYDIGALDRAEAQLLEILDAMLPEIQAGIPVVGLEPSCVAVFRDELVNLFPTDDRAQALSRQTFLLSEFLEKHAKNFRLPNIARKALVHGHCHHKALMKMTAEENVLQRMGLDFHQPSAGCCGMAGAFGFEKGKYDVSRDIGELELLPAVRAASLDTIIISNGFSCREQIAQETKRHALHLAEVIQMGLRQHSDPIPAECPERPGVRRREQALRHSMNRSVWTLAGLAASCALIWSLATRRE